LSGTANAAAPAGHEKQEKVTEIISQKSPLSAEAAFFIGQYCTIFVRYCPESASGEPVGFMGTAGKRLVMFFLLPEEHGKDSGMQHYGIEEDIVNEHDPKIAGFYAFTSPIPLDTDTFL
jgi:hypothetical protein